MSDAKDIARNTVFVASGDIAGRILTLVIAVFIARILGSEQYGIFVFAYAFPSFLLVLADWGFGPVFVLHVSKDRSLANKYFTNIVVMRTLLSVLAYSIMVISAFLLGFAGHTLNAIIVIGAASMMFNIGEIFFSVCIAFQRTEYFVLARIAERVFTTAFVLILLSTGYGLVPITFAILSGASLFIVVSYVLVSSRFARLQGIPDLRFLKGLVREGFPFMLSVIFASVFFSVVIILLTLFKGSSATGYFNAAFALVISATLLPGYLGPAIFPVMSKHAQTSKDYVRKVLHKSQKYFFIIGLPMAVGGFILADPIITAIYGESFFPSVFVLQILIWDIAITLFLTGVKYCLVSFNLIRLHVASFGTGALLNLSLCLLLIPMFSYVGACVAFITSRLIVVSLLVYFTATRIGPLGIRRIIPKPAVASGLMAMVLWSLSWINFLILIPIGILVYFSVLYLMRTFDEEDKRILGNALTVKWRRRKARD